MTGYEDSLNALKMQLEDGLPIVKAKRTELKEKGSALDLYESAYKFIPAVFGHYQSTRSFEGLNADNAPLYIINLFLSHERMIESQYNSLAEKIGSKGLVIDKNLKIGKNYLKTIAPIINESDNNIGHLFAIYLREITEDFGGCKLYNDMLTKYKSFLKT